MTCNFLKMLKSATIVVRLCGCFTIFVTFTGDPRAARRIRDLRQISARDKRTKREYDTICTKSVLREVSPPRCILGVDDTFKSRSIHHIDHPTWSSSWKFARPDPSIKDSRDLHQNCVNAIQKYRGDPRWWFHDRKIMSSSSNSPSSKTFESSPSSKTSASSSRLPSSFETTTDICFLARKVVMTRILRGSRRVHISRSW